MHGDEPNFGGWWVILVSCSPRCYEMAENSFFLITCIHTGILVGWSVYEETTLPSIRLKVH